MDLLYSETRKFDVMKVAAEALLSLKGMQEWKRKWKYLDECLKFYRDVTGMKFDINIFCDKDENISIREMWTKLPWETFDALSDYIEPPEDLLGDLLDNTYSPPENAYGDNAKREFDKANNYKLEKLFHYK